MTSLMVSLEIVNECSMKIYVEFNLHARGKRLDSALFHQLRA
jgi:hypothetical protein